MKKIIIVLGLVLMFALGLNTTVQAGRGIRGWAIPFCGRMAIFPGQKTILVPFPEAPENAKALITDIIVMNGNPYPVNDTDISYININAYTETTEYTLLSTIRTIGNEWTVLSFSTGIPTQAGTRRIGVVNLSMSSTVVFVVISGYFYSPLRWE